MAIGDIKRDSSKLDKITLEMSTLDGVTIRAGALRGQRRGKSGRFGLSHATVLAIHEFGGGNVPARMPIKKGLIAGKRKIDKAWKTGVEKIHAGTAGAELAEEAMSEILVDAIKDGIRKGLPPALAASTLANPDRDSRGIPLLDTEQLIDSIEAEAKKQ